MQRVFALLVLVVGAVAVVSVAVPAGAIDVFSPCQADTTKDTSICKAVGKDKLFGAGGTWNKILNTITYIVGAVSVLMIIVGGLRYTLSAGDSSAISAAKNTIIYAAVGLVIASLSNAIVNFVLTNV